MTEAVDQHLDLLGYHVTDKITLEEGVVVSISFDLFGCVQAAVDCGKRAPDGTKWPQFWWDTKRLTVDRTRPRAMHPDPWVGVQETAGPADKPAFDK